MGIIHIYKSLLLLPIGTYFTERLELKIRYRFFMNIRLLLLFSCILSSEKT